ncbi:MAG: hypothetical protein K1W30_20485 [Lachnospiraceae bacterium]
MLRIIQRGLLTAILYTFIILTLCACGNSEVEKFADETAAVFASGDIAEINSLVFGDVYLPVDSRLEGIVEDEPIQNGLLTELFSHSTVDVNKVKKGTIQFVVSAPDMTAVFECLPDDASNFTENDLYEYIIKYASSTETIEFTVEVPFSSEDGEIVIEYRDEAFINAITGGLVEAYKDLYTEVLDQYRRDE